MFIDLAPRNIIINIFSIIILLPFIILFSKNPFYIENSNYMIFIKSYINFLIN